MSRLKYWHTMLRISEPEETLRFFDVLGLKEVNKIVDEEGRFTLHFLAVPGDEDAAQLELTHNWDEKRYDSGRNFGHLAFYVENIYNTCQRFIDAGVPISRPPRDGRMAFVRTPDDISVELIQAEALAPQEPWASMPNVGSW